MIFDFLLPLIAVAGMAPQELRFSERTGLAPLTVRIQDPPLLLEKARSCKRVFGNYGFTVDWGDGSPVPAGESCLKRLEHTYTVPGVYTVKADVFHLGENDAPEVEWQRESKVTVLAGASKLKPALKFVSRLAGKEFPYGEGFPPILVHLQTSGKLQLVSEFQRESGKILFVDKREVSNSGEQEITWPDYGNGPPSEMYERYRLRAKISVRLLEEGREVAQASSGVFTLLGRIAYRTIEAVPVRGKAPLQVKFGVQHNFPDCYSYIVEWGDGSADDRNESLKPREKCGFQSSLLELRHTYHKPGRFLVRWFDNNSSPGKPAKKDVGYLEKPIQVTR